MANLPIKQVFDKSCGDHIEARGTHTT